MNHALVRASWVRSGGLGSPSRFAPRITLVCAALLMFGLVGCWCLLPREPGLRQAARFPQGLATEASQFDCFSRPAVAAAILEHEADRLVADYREWHEDQDAQAGLALSRVIPASQAATSKGGPVNERPVPAAVRTAATMRALEELEGRIRRLHRHVAVELLRIYSESENPEGYLDHYLYLIREAADDREADTAAGIIWRLRLALAWSEQCGRADEVLDAVQHVTRFQRQAGAAELQHALGVLMDERLATSRP